jgi:DNA-binding transcriptional LysR family regulator
VDIEELQTFIEVADSGGVSPAARRLGVSKSIVSRRLARLESELGVQLLARSTRGAALTEAGTAFRDYAARVVAEIDAAKETISPEGELRGRLRVAAPLSFGPTHFAHILADMARRYPRLHIHASYSDRIVDLIGEGYDCAIRVGYLQDSNLLAKLVGPVYAKWVASPGYVEAYGAPETPEELVTHECVMQGTESWPAVVGDKIISMNPQGRFKADNGAALIAATLAGIGIAVLPVDLIEDHLASGDLVEVMPQFPPPKLGIYVVRPRAQNPSRKVSVLTEMLTECFGSHKR